MPETNLGRRKGAKSSSTLSDCSALIPSPKRCVLLMVFVVFATWAVISASFFASSALLLQATGLRETFDVLEQHEIIQRPQFQPSRRVTPYKNRTQQLLPNWARKPFFMAMDASPQVCFVHIGKTAGSTLACLLGFEYSCEFQRILNGELPQKTTHLNHNFINDCPETADYYLIATRDPLERIKSWFAYERPSNSNDPNWAAKKPLFVDCPYGTLNELAEKGLSPNSSNISHECKYRAWEAIRGKKPYCRHNYYNYQYYMKTIPENARILAIRSEHMAEDWNTAEAIISAADTPVQISEEAFKPRNKTRQKRKADTELSSEAQKLVCRALCKEIRTYEQILLRAENLDSTQFEKSMKLLDETCPEQSRADRCL